jgi:wyosine [tRNA(Phe)-imidazoG37] synthetase (radical SAM superfamily)
VVNCNLNCAYCEVDRAAAPRAQSLDVDRVVKELGETLELVQGGWLRQWPRYRHLPDELLEVRHVALSGDGEPTLSRDFVPATRAIVEFRQTVQPFKIVLVTNSTGLDQPDVQDGLNLLGPQDEIWAKLDAGTQDYFTRVNGSTTSLGRVLTNILLVAQHRPVVIQSLFPAIDGQEPPVREIDEYVHRLKELKGAGAEIPLVQIYSANRPAARHGCSHLPLKSLSRIAQRVQRIAGLRAEVF